MGSEFGSPPGGSSGPGHTSPYTYMAGGPTKQEGGNWVWDAAKGVWNFIKDNGGDVLSTAGGVVEGYMSSQDRAKQLEELKRQYDLGLLERGKDRSQQDAQFTREQAEREAARQQGNTQFERTTGNAEAQAAVRAQTQLNAAPMADKAQALLLQRMGVAPGQFQGRDYTKGTNDLSRSAAAPSANVTSAMQTAAQNYRPGDGGVDTSTIKMLLEKMKGSGFGGGTPPVTKPGEARPRPPVIPPVIPPTGPVRPPRTIPVLPPGTALPPVTPPGPSSAIDRAKQAVAQARAATSGASGPPPMPDDDPNDFLRRRMEIL